ncbi:unnamed protein product [Ceutorhynchus assimilis]|uniref:HMG box domain-containing protein n=1 Tax=Ceutorhynchus assimilis TaxID=467358 RepID=A0A9N9N3W5_9CUCU|nr:unnamed protein product [Ceutorhynchus assimilis]
MGKSTSSKNDISITKSKRQKGKVTKNPFLNFLGQFRTTKVGLSAPKIAQLGGHAWRSMSEQEKAPFILMAKNCKSTPRTQTEWHKKKGRKSKKKIEAVVEANNIAEEPKIVELSADDSAAETKQI